MPSIIKRRFIAFYLTATSGHIQQTGNNHVFKLASKLFDNKPMPAAAAAVASLSKCRIFTRIREMGGVATDIKVMW